LRFRKGIVFLEAAVWVAEKENLFYARFLENRPNTGSTKKACGKAGF
jgi:hypothetical protein